MALYELSHNFYMLFEYLEGRGNIYHPEKHMDTIYGAREAIGILLKAPAFREYLTVNIPQEKERDNVITRHHIEEWALEHYPLGELIEKELKEKFVRDWPI